jgi:microcystin-dependent protein
MPVGMVVPFAGAEPPEGFLRCDGAAVSRGTFANLFAVVGTVYGAGDGATTFNVPDLRGRVPLGMGAGTGLSDRALGTKGGEEGHVLTTGELPSHSHALTTKVHSVNVGGGEAAYGNFSIPGQTATGLTGEGASHNTMPPFLGLNFLIKA